MREAVAIVLDELRGAARFRWLALATAWLICCAGWAVVLLVLPGKYEATTRVFVDTRTALSPVIQGLAIQQDVAAHLNLAQEALVGKAQLTRIARETGLDAKAVTSDQRAKLLDDLRRNINLGTAFTQQAGAIVHTIAYRDEDQGRSLKVVEMLLDSFIEDTLGGKRESSDTAKSFLVEQIASNEQLLRDAETRLAEFKKRNVGLMPGSEGDYFTRLQTEMDAVRKARADLGVAMSRRNELLAQLSGETPFSVASEGPDSQSAGSNTSSQIADAERRLAAMLLRVTEKHPDVIAARAEIESLKIRQAEELEALKQGDAGAALSAGARANPIYRSIQLALNEAEVRGAELRGDIRQRETKIAELQRLVNTVPEVEAEFARLNRDYEATRAQYAALVDRLNKAELGQSAEDTSAVRFEVVDPPAVSAEPVTPRRPLLVTMVFAAAVGGAALIALLLNRIRPVFGSTRELLEATGLPVLGEVSLIDVDGFERVQKRSYMRLAGGAAALFLAFGFVLHYSLTHRLM
jgi:polysaccharide chain length determinant protein (PEP-CTERM system associated)